MPEAGHRRGARRLCSIPTVLSCEERDWRPMIGNDCVQNPYNRNGKDQECRR